MSFEVDTFFFKTYDPLAVLKWYDRSPTARNKHVQCNSGTVSLGKQIMSCSKDSMDSVP